MPSAVKVSKTEPVRPYVDFLWMGAIRPIKGRGSLRRGAVGGRDDSMVSDRTNDPAAARPPHARCTPGALRLADWVI